MQKGYHYRAVTSTYAGVAQRWLIIQSDAAKKRNLASQIKKFSERTLIESKAFSGLYRKGFACEIDARNALKELEKRLKYTSLHEVQIVERPGYKKSGCPIKSCFVLATNQLNKEELSDEEILIRYKDQSKVEKGFRFLKDPMFLSSALFLKNRKRITALLMVMTICLLVYNENHVLLVELMGKRYEKYYA